MDGSLPEESDAIARQDCSCRRRRSAMRRRPHSSRPLKNDRQPRPPRHAARSLLCRTPMRSILSRSIHSLLPKTTSHRRRVSLLASSLLLSFAPVHAATFIWSTDASSAWENGANWGGTAPNEADALADFSTIEITGNRTVTLGADFTVGALKFGDLTANTTLANWTVAGTGRKLTLQTTTGEPAINVSANVGAAIISAGLAGAQGFTLSGSGVLRLSGGTANTITGGFRLGAGTELQFTPNSLGTNVVEFIADSTLTFNGTNTQDVSSLIKIDDGVTATIGTGANNVTFATPLQTGLLGTGGLLKNGAGTLTITGANTYTGLTRVRVGRIVLAGGDNRLSASGTIALGQNAQVGILQLGDAAAPSNQTTTSLVMTGSGTTNAVVGGNASVSTLTINNTSAVTYAGLLGGTGTNQNNLALVKAGSGTLTVSNAGNTFSGGVGLNQGVLSFANGSLASNLVTIGGTATLQWNGANTQDISARLKIEDGVIATLDTGTNTVTLASPLQTGALSTGAVTKSSAGTLILTAQNTWTGNTRISNGRLVLAGGSDRLSSATALQLGQNANSGVLQLGDSTGPSHQTIRALSVTGNASSLSNAIVGGSAGISTLTLNNATAVTYAGLLGGVGSNENNLALTKSGAGALTLSGVNTFLGDVTIGGGSVTIKNASALGTGAKTVSIAAATNTPSLRLDGAGGDFTLASSLSLITSNDSVASPAIVNVAGHNTIAGNISPTTGGAGTGQTRIQAAAGSLTLNGAIAPAAGAESALSVIFDGTGNGVANGVLANTGVVDLGVTKDGAGTWTLTNANTYRGATQINAGRLNITAAQTGGGAISLGDGATLGVTLTAAGQSLQSSAVTFGTAAATTLALDLGSFGNPSAPVFQTGALAINGPVTISIAALGLSITDGVTVPYIPLFSYTSLAGLGASGLTLGVLPARVQATLVDDAANSAVKLNVTAFDVPKWTGSIDGNWNIDDGTGTVGSLNWTLSTGGATGYYQEGSFGTDSVRFDDTAAGAKDINLTTILKPTTATVVTATSYTFSGTGKLSGATKLVKQGTGRLILVNTGGNDYTGTTTISGGVLQVGDGATIGAGQLGSGAIVNNGTLELNRPDDIGLGNTLSGNGLLRKLAPGVLILSGNNSTYDGAIEVASGTLKVGNTNALGSTVGATTVASGATLDLTGFSIGENVLLNGGTIKATTGTASGLTGSLTLTGDGIADVSAGTSLTLGGTIAGAGGLQKNNLGTLVITANGSYAGTTTIRQGTLQFGAASGAGTTGAPGAGDIILSPAVDTAATLAIYRADSYHLTNTITSSDDGINSVVIGVGGATSPSGTITFSGTNTFTGNVTIVGGGLKITNSSALGVGSKTVTIGNASRPGLLLDGSLGNIALASSISYAISSDGAGTAVGSAAGSIVNVAGDNVINGTISLVNGGGGNGRLTAQGGTLTVNGSIDANGSNGSRVLLLGGAASGFVHGAISDLNLVATSIVGVTKDGPGTWTLTGENTFTGAVTVSDGTLKIQSVAPSGTAQPLGAAASAITLGTATTAGTLDYTGGEATLARGITVGGVGGGVLKNSGGSTLTLSGTITRASRPLTFAGGSFHVTGQITGASANLNVLGGSVMLSQTANNYVGATNVSGGATLRNGASEVLTNGTILTLGDSTGNTGGTYDLNGFSETIAGLSGAGAGTKIVTNSAANGISTLTITGTSTFDGMIQDGATARVALTKSTGGTLTLSGANTYSGATTVDQGTLKIGAASALPAEADLHINAGGVLDAGGFHLSVAKLSGSGLVTNSGGGATLNLGGGSFNGQIADGSGQLSVVKAGADLLTLSGANTYSGPTAIQGGTFLVAGSIAGSGINVGSGSTIGGSGLISTGDQPFTLALGATLAPGSGIGTLTINTGLASLDLSAAVTASASGSLLFELGPVAASDRVTLNSGTLEIGAGGLAFDDFIFTLQPDFEGGTYVLFSTESLISGSLDLGPGQLTGLVGGFEAAISFADNATDIVLTIVPEPGPLTALMGGLVVLLGLRRRPRKFQGR